MLFFYQVGTTFRSKVQGCLGNARGTHWISARMTWLGVSSLLLQPAENVFTSFSILFSASLWNGIKHCQTANWNCGWNLVTLSIEVHWPKSMFEASHMEVPTRATMGIDTTPFPLWMASRLTINPIWKAVALRVFGLFCCVSVIRRVGSLRAPSTTNQEWSPLEWAASLFTTPMKSMTSSSSSARILISSSFAATQALSTSKESTTFHALEHGTFMSCMLYGIVKKQYKQRIYRETIGL